MIHKVSLDDGGYVTLFIAVNRNNHQQGQQTLEMIIDFI